MVAPPDDDTPPRKRFIRVLFIFPLLAVAVCTAVYAFAPKNHNLIEISKPVRGSEVALRYTGRYYCWLSPNEVLTVAYPYSGYHGTSGLNTLTHQSYVIDIGRGTSRHLAALDAALDRHDPPRMLYAGVDLNTMCVRLFGGFCFDFNGKQIEHGVLHPHRNPIEFSVPGSGPDNRLITSPTTGKTTYQLVTYSGKLLGAQTITHPPEMPSSVVGVLPPAKAIILDRYRNLMMLNLTDGVRTVQDLLRSLPKEASIANAVLSPAGDRIAYEVMTFPPEPTSMLEKLFARLGVTRPKGIRQAIYTGKLGSDKLVEVGNIPDPFITRKWLSNIQWLPDGKRLSFIYDTKLWVVPAS